SLLKHLALSRRSRAREELGVAGGEYAVVTLHRPSNVDDAGVLRGIVGALAEISARLPVVFPAHPRTRKMLAEFGLLESIGRAPAPGAPRRGAAHRHSGTARRQTGYSTRSRKGKSKKAKGTSEDGGQRASRLHPDDERRPVTCLPLLPFYFCLLTIARL